MRRKPANPPRWPEGLHDPMRGDETTVEKNTSNLLWRPAHEPTARRPLSARWSEIVELGRGVAEVSRERVSSKDYSQSRPLSNSAARLQARHVIGAVTQARCALLALCRLLDRRYTPSEPVTSHAARPTCARR